MLRVARVLERTQSEWRRSAWELTTIAGDLDLTRAGEVLGPVLGGLLVAAGGAGVWRWTP